MLARDGAQYRLAVSPLPAPGNRDALIAGNRLVSHCNIGTERNHDAVLVPDGLDMYGERLPAHLRHLPGEPAKSGEPCLTSMSRFS